MLTFTKRARQATVVVGGSLAVLTVAGIAYAANLGLSSNSLGSGSSTVTACQPSASPSIVASWSPGPAGIADTAGGFVANGVEITNVVTAACAGKTMYVSINNGTAVIGSGSVQVPASPGPIHVSLSPAPAATSIPASSIAGVNILIPN